LYPPATQRKALALYWCDLYMLLGYAGELLIR
jgi:hypothetical protein